MSAPSDEYLTLVCHNSPEAQKLMSHECCRAMSWSHALWDRDKAIEERDSLAAALREATRVLSDLPGVTAGGRMERVYKDCSAALAKLDGKP